MVPIRFYPQMACLLFLREPVVPTAKVCRLKASGALVSPDPEHTICQSSTRLCSGPRLATPQHPCSCRRGSFTFSPKLSTKEMEKMCLNALLGGWIIKILHKFITRNFLSPLSGVWQIHRAVRPPPPPVLDSFITRKEVLYPSAVTYHLSLPLAATALFPVSVDLPLLTFHVKRTLRHAAFQGSSMSWYV